MPLCYVVVLICYVVFGFCSIFFTFSLYYSVVQKWRLSSVFGGFPLTPPPWRGGSGGWAAGRRIAPRGGREDADAGRGRSRTPGDNRSGRAHALGGRAGRGGTDDVGRHRTQTPGCARRRREVGRRVGLAALLYSAAALAVGRKRRGGSAENVGSRTFGGRVMSTGRAVSGAPRPDREAHLCVP